jgi:hypothetical protein
MKNFDIELAKECNAAADKLLRELAADIILKKSLFPSLTEINLESGIPAPVNNKWKFVDWASPIIIHRGNVDV